MIPATFIAARVFEARAIVLDPHSPESLRKLAWRVLTRWGAR